MQALQLSAARTPCLAAGRCPGQASAAAVSMPCRGMAATLGPLSRRWSFAAPLAVKGYASARDRPALPLWIAVLCAWIRMARDVTRPRNCRLDIWLTLRLRLTTTAPCPRSSVQYAQFRSVPQCSTWGIPMALTPAQGVCRSQMLTSKRPRVASRARTAAVRADAGAPHQCKPPVSVISDANVSVRSQCAAH